MPLSNRSPDTTNELRHHRGVGRARSPRPRSLFQRPPHPRRRHGIESRTDRTNPDICPACPVCPADAGVCSVRASIGCLVPMSGWPGVSTRLLLADVTFGLAAGQPCPCEVSNIADWSEHHSMVGCHHGRVCVWCCAAWAAASALAFRTSMASRHCAYPSLSGLAP